MDGALRVSSLSTLPNSMFTISKEFHFDAAHSLPHLPETHKCHHLHGHTYKLVVFVTGAPRNQWVQDYAEIADAVRPVVAMLDHKNLDEVLGCVTTAENICSWVWMQLQPKLPLLYRVDIHETPGTCCSFCPKP